MFLLQGCATQAASGGFGAGLRQVPASPQVRELEQRMFRRLNADRGARGKPPLRYDDRLAGVARSHSTEMRERGFLDHISPTTGTPENRLDAAGYLFLVARENLAQADSVDNAEADLLKSPRHHANIVADDITHVGIGVAETRTGGSLVLLFTQLFARPAQLESPAAARQTLSARIQKARRAQGLGPILGQRALDELAQTELKNMPDDPSPRDLYRIRDALSSRLREQPLPGVRGLVVSGQVLADTSGYELSEALLRPGARCYGMAVERSTARGKRPLLRVLLLVGQ